MIVKNFVNFQVLVNGINTSHIGSYQPKERWKNFEAHVYECWIFKHCVGKKKLDKKKLRVGFREMFFSLRCSVAEFKCHQFYFCCCCCFVPHRKVLKPLYVSFFTHLLRFQGFWKLLLCGKDADWDLLICWAQSRSWLKQSHVISTPVLWALWSHCALLTRVHTVTWWK